MIYLFTWNSDFLVREKTLSWKKLFTEKNWDFNLVHFKNLLETDNNALLENLLAEGFMWEKKLLIIDNFPLTAADRKNSKLSEKQDFLETIISQIPQNNIVIFSSANPDKRSKFFKLIKKQATKIEEFNTKWENDIVQIIQKKYGNFIDFPATNLLIKYKGWSLEKSIWEIQKILITKEHISTSDIKKYIKPELEESIFQVIDDILNLQISQAIKKISSILDDTNIYAFYNNLLANLRTNVYISKLKDIKLPQWEISSTLQLWNRAFLVNKNYKISYKKLEFLYINLVWLDKKMKSWKLLWTQEKDLQYEIEKCLIWVTSNQYLNLLK